MEFLNNVLDFIFPPSCVICNKIDKQYLCKECEVKIEKYIHINTIKEMKDDRFHLLKYAGLVREKMIQYKFYNKAYLYNFFCEILMKNKKACEFLKSYDIIIPVPIHKKRKRMRGYNQSELIAEKVANNLNLKIGKDVLYKNKHTKPQSSMDKVQRLKNAQGVYIVENKHKILNKNVVILDDIYTTGATANECRKILLLSGAKKVGIITIAKD